MHTHNRWRLAVGITAAATVALGAAGCSTDVGVDDDASAAPGTLTIFWKGSEEAGIQAAIDAYADVAPDIDIQLTTADVEQYQATLRTQLSAGSAADVFLVWPAFGNPAALQEIAPGGFLEDLSDRPWASQYPESLAPLFQYEDATYVMAPAVTAFGPWYNQGALDEAGLEAPTTWSEVLPYCEAARAAGVTGFAIGAATPNATQGPLYGLVPDLVYSEGMAFDDELLAGETTFSDQPGWVEAMDKYEQMINAGCFQDDATGAAQDEQNRLVAEGEALGMFAIGSQLGTLQTLAPDATFSLVPFSGDDDGSRDVMTVSNAGGAAVNASTERKDDALAFVDWLATPEGLAAYTGGVAGAIPSIPSGEAIDDPALQVISDHLADGDTVHFLNQFWPNAQIEQAMYSGVQGMLAGSGAAGDVLTAMDDAIAR